MPLTPEQKAQAVTHLTTNCECWKGKADTLNALPDEALVDVYNDKVKVQEAEHIYNAVRTFAGDDTLTTNAMPAALAKGKPKKKPPMEMGEEDDTDLEGEPAMNVEQYLAKAPKPIADAITNALKIVDREKTELVGKLVANCATPEAKAKATTTYNKLDADDLRTLVADIPVATINATNPNGGRRNEAPIPARLQPLFIGNAGGGNGTGTPTEKTGAGATTNTKVLPLGLPEIDHATFWGDRSAKR